MKGCMTCNSSCLWKVSCYFSNFQAWPLCQRATIFWFCDFSWRLFCNTAQPLPREQALAGAGSGQATAVWVQAALLSISHTCIDLYCGMLIGYFTPYALLWVSDTAISPWVAESLQVDADHLFCTTGHPGVPPAWLAGRWEWPPGLRKTTVAMRHHETIQEVKILLWRRSTALSLYMSYSQNLP